MDSFQILKTGLSDRYEIEQGIGHGGMATVYLARDLKHNRKVALKVLRPELSAVLGPERFLAEIEVTAKLQHPHLLPLFDSGEADGLLFYVMPYVEGESLRDRLLREKQLPVDEAVRIAVAVASALDYAHRHQVVHRDLKPENILLHDGQPLVADFGIALAVTKAGGPRITETGLSMGTPQYMSPEQASGDRPIDARSDIYSLGAVLYETLTGEPPHTGATVQAIMARVLTERPKSVRLMRETVPEHVDAAMLHALARLPADRFTQASDFADALTGRRPVTLVRTPSAVPVSADNRRRTWLNRLQWAPLGLAVMLAAWITLAPEPSHESGVPGIFEVTLDDVIPTGGVALSPDGTQMAFAGNAPSGRGIFLRRMNGLPIEFVRGTENAILPVFSPDGEWILFDAPDNKIKKVRVSGGSTVTIVDSASIPSHADWADDGHVVFAGGGALWRVSSDGGQPMLLAKSTGIDGPEARPQAEPGIVIGSGQNDYRRQNQGDYYSLPHALPGANAAVFSVQKGLGRSGYEIAVVTIPDGKVTELGIRGLNPRFAASGHIVFGSTDEQSGTATAPGSLHAAPFSLRHLRVTGPPIRLIDGVRITPNGAVNFAMSDNGTLLYHRTGASSLGFLTAVNRQGQARPITQEPRNYSWPRLSPDGRRVALAIGFPDDIWVYELASGNHSRLTNNKHSTERPEWTPDGKRVAYIARDTLPCRRVPEHEQHVNCAVVMARAWDGSGAPEVLLALPRRINEFSFGPAGTYIAVRVDPPRDIWIAPMDSLQAARPFVATDAFDYTPRVSPDGRLLAYVSDESGRSEVYVRPLPGPGAVRKVSIDGGREPIWSRDGKELFFRGRTHLMAATIDRSAELTVTHHDSLFADIYARAPRGHHWNYDVFPDGQQFLMVKSTESQATKLFAIVNWTTDLSRKVPTGRSARGASTY